MGSTVVWVVAALIVIAGIVVWRRPVGGRATPDALKPGQAFGPFNAMDEHGEAVTQDNLRGKPTIVLFVRGNWCPFCNAQVADMTSHYKEIVDLGGRLVILTPKPLETTRRVGEMYGVDFEFWLDEGLAVTRRFGLLIEDGVPNKSRDSFGDDAVWPAAVVIDAEGVIRYSELSRAIVDRPSSAKLLNQLKKLL
ncbi:MAG: peroxiredoxin family protein [Pseudomonadota bacterium]